MTHLIDVCKIHEVLAALLVKVNILNTKNQRLTVVLTPIFFLLLDSPLIAENMGEGCLLECIWSGYLEAYVIFTYFKVNKSLNKYTNSWEA